MSSITTDSSLGHFGTVWDSRDTTGQVGHGGTQANRVKAISYGFHVRRMVVRSRNISELFGIGLKYRKRSDDLAHQVVFVGLGYLYVVNFTDMRFKAVRNVVDQNIAVDFLGLSFKPPLEKEIGFLRKSFENDRVCFA